MYNTIYHTCLHNRLPQDETTFSKHVADTKNQELKDLTAVTDSSHDDHTGVSACICTAAGKVFVKGKTVTNRSVNV